MSQRIIVTCGPSYEPIDEARRITNFSTGELGARLSNRLTSAGYRVVCFRGEMATWRGAVKADQVVSFSTNDDLFAKLRKVALAGEAKAVFHTAALADFRVQRDGKERKISSRCEELKLTLYPATRVIAQLRLLFPKAVLVGWKYELDGTREDALAKGCLQIVQNRTDACVVNGAAYGSGFGVVKSEGEPSHCQNKVQLCDWLATWIATVG
jgi:phosphopantothenoylcysteine decarboxylase/phosphopantothenate--cysteine ligase